MTTINREIELDRLGVVLDRGFPVLEAWEVGLLLGSKAETTSELGRFARSRKDIPQPVINSTAPKWAPGAIRSFLAGEWSAPTRLDGLRIVTEAAS